MPYKNESFLMGHLGKPAETKFVSSGHSITTFSIAVEVGTKDRPRTAWIDVKAWNQCQAALDCLQKGALIAVMGRTDQETWDDKDTGKKRSKTLVVADMIFLPLWEKKEKTDDGGVVSRPRSSKPAAPMTQEITDEDVPF
jgi:single-strand DNA-binding protein